MTQRRKRWPGTLDKPIIVLPADKLTYGGAITSENTDDFNKKARVAIDATLKNERLRKLPLLAAYYGVGPQAYAALIKAIAHEFVRGFDGDIDVLRKTYVVDDNKSLALVLAEKYVPGFQYKPAKFAAESTALFTDVETKEVRRFGSGAMRPQKTGRKTIWDTDMLLALLTAVKKARHPGEDIATADFSRMRNRLAEYARAKN